MKAKFEAGPAPILTFAGGLQEVRHQLGSVKAGQVVAVVLDESSQAEAKAIEQVITQIIRLTLNTLTTRSDETLSCLVETLLPEEMPTPTLLKEAGMMLRAKEAVIKGADWLTAAQVASIARLAPRHPSAQLHKWQRDGAIFAIRLNRINYFPSYALDPTDEYQPYRSLAQWIYLRKILMRSLQLQAMRRWESCMPEETGKTIRAVAVTESATAFNPALFIGTGRGSAAFKQTSKNPACASQRTQ